MGINILGGLTGLASGGPLGALLGAFGGGDGKQPYQTNTTNLRPLDAKEQSVRDSALTGLAGMGSGAYDPKIFEALWGPMSTEIKGRFAKQKGQMTRSLASTGGGPGSIFNEMNATMGKGEADALASGRAGAMTSAAGMTTQQRQTLNSLYSTITGAQNIGAGQSVFFPGDNRNQAMAIGMDALRNKDSWFNKKGGLGGLLGIGGL